MTRVVLSTAIYEPTADEISFRPSSANDHTAFLGLNARADVWITVDRGGDLPETPAGVDR